MPNGVDTPHGIIGDSTRSDYRVSVDFRLPNGGTAEVLGRGIERAPGVWTGYRLGISADGGWKGSTGPPCSRWARLALRSRAGTT